MINDNKIIIRAHFYQTSFDYDFTTPLSTKPSINAASSHDISFYQHILIFNSFTVNRNKSE